MSFFKGLFHRHSFCILPGVYRCSNSVLSHSRCPQALLEVGKSFALHLKGLPDQVTAMDFCEEMDGATAVWPAEKAPPKPGKSQVPGISCFNDGHGTRARHGLGGLLRGVQRPICRGFLKRRRKGISLTEAGTKRSSWWAQWVVVVRGAGPCSRYLVRQMGCGCERD